jgi:hypothetical protein
MPMFRLTADNAVFLTYVDLFTRSLPRSSITPELFAGRVCRTWPGCQPQATFGRTACSLFWNGQSPSWRFPG